MQILYENATKTFGLNNNTEIMKQVVLNEQNIRTG